MSIIKKNTEFPCYLCDGKKGNKKCKACNGTGIYKDSTYYHIDDKQKICFDGDTLK